MIETILKIKRALIEQRFFFTMKAKNEIVDDKLTEIQVLESVINAPGIYKTLRSRSPMRAKPGEKLIVIIGLSFDGLEIYTKGTFKRTKDGVEYYHFISCKRSD